MVYVHILNEDSVEKFSNFCTGNRCKHDFIMERKDTTWKMYDFRNEFTT